MREDLGGEIARCLRVIEEKNMKDVELCKKKVFER